MLDMYLQTILHNEKKSGVTFHLIDENFDKGNILIQKEIEILPDNTSKELKDRTVYQARLLCSEILSKLGEGLIIPVPQNEKEATYFANIKPTDMMLNFEKETAEQIQSRIKAFHPWLPCYVTYKTKYFIPNPYKLKILDKEYTQKILEKSNIKKYKDEYPNTSIMIITHHPKILEYLNPDFVHIMSNGKIVKTGDYSLAFDIEKNGYNNYLNNENVITDGEDYE